MSIGDLLLIGLIIMVLSWEKAMTGHGFKKKLSSRVLHICMINIYMNNQEILAIKRKILMIDIANC
jgi:hypothetical protein